MKIESAKKRKLVFVIVGIAIGIVVAATLYFLNRPTNSNTFESSTENAEEIVEIEETKEEEIEENVEEISEPETKEEEVAQPAEKVEEINWGKYYIKVNRKQNVVMVYTPDQNGEFTRLAKTFVSSVGREDSETPLGVFSILSRYEALYLVGDVWGHYATQISGPYYFHSVPYYTKGNPNWDNLEYLEYNKLGEGASAGCVRLAAQDAEWIFVNVPYGTTVEIYDSEELPEGVVKPTPIRIDENDERRGWDPTDSNPANPWKI